MNEKYIIGLGNYTGGELIVYDKNGKNPKKIDISIPSGPTHIPKGIINKKSPNPIGVFFEFLYLNHNLTNKYVEDKKAIDIAAPKRDSKLSK